VAPPSQDKGAYWLVIVVTNGDHLLSQRIAPLSDGNWHLPGVIIGGTGSVRSNRYQLILLHTDDNLIKEFNEHLYPRDQKLSAELVARAQLLHRVEVRRTTLNDC